MTGASRTDAGVHALRQAVSLTAGVALGGAAVRGALNAALPRDVRVLDGPQDPPFARYRRSLALVCGLRYP